MSHHLRWSLPVCVLLLGCPSNTPKTCPGLDDGNPCTADSCVGTTARHLPVDQGTACDMGVCDAIGQCVECLASSDCTAPLSCDPITHFCSSTSEACTDGLKDGNETGVDCGGSCAPTRQCTTGGGCAVGGDCQSGVCTAGACVAGRCGDGIQQPNEGCDDGNGVNGDGCDDGMGGSCKPTGCGNGTRSGGEACDDGNMVNADGCDNNCTITACGNGITGGSETCDDGNTRGSDGCSAGCRIEAGWACTGTPSVCTSSCGDGQVSNGEQCDDGNHAGGDGCSSNCYRETGYTCTGAPSVCVPTCGDGIKATQEGCDDGDTMGGDGCSATCTVETGFSCSGTPSVCAPVCGDGRVVAPETCDDGDTMSGDGCSTTCRIEAGYVCAGMPSICSGNCGDGVVQGNETCDDGNATANDGCTSCQTDTGYACAGMPSSCHSVCGDGLKAATEACDDGDTMNGDGCASNCTIEPGYACTGVPSVCTVSCGDGAKAASEGCDDGNTANGDGCSATCTVETNWTCTAASPSVCRGVCGDGIRVTGEACDDGDTTSGDGCSSSCVIELGWTCTGTPSTCTTTCGDGVKAAPEGCDDHNTTNGDGCSATCTVETGWSCTGTAPSVCTNRPVVCGDGFVDAPEQCDDSNTRPLDGCSATCRTESAEVEPNEDGSPSTGGSGINGNDFGVTYPNMNGARLASTRSDAILAAISPTGDEDVFALRNDLTTPATVRLDVWNRATGYGQGVACGSSIDTGMHIRSATGASLVSNDDRNGASDRCSALSYTVPAGTTVYAHVIKYGDTGTIAAYALQIQWTPIVCGDGVVAQGEECDDGNQNDTDACTNTCTYPTEVEPNNTSSQADASPVTISGSKVIRGAITPTGDVDRFKVTVATATVVRFETFTTLFDCALGTTTLRLYNAGGTQLYVDNTSGIGSCSAIVTYLTPGTYYVQVEETGNNATLATYYLEASYQVHGTNETEAPNTTGGNETDATAEAGLVSLSNGWVFGDKMNSNDYDVWAITVPPGKSVRAEIIEGNATTCESGNMDTALLIYDASASLITDDDDDGRGLCSLLDGTGATPFDSGLKNTGTTPVTWYLRVDYSFDISTPSNFQYRLQVTLR